jgi:hypothetical protein
LNGFFGGHINLVLTNSGDGTAIFAMLAIACTWYDMIATHVTLYIFKVSAGVIFIFVALILEVEETRIATLSTEDVLEVVIRCFLFGDSARHNWRHLHTILTLHRCASSIFFFKIENILYDGLQVVHFVLNLPFLHLTVNHVALGYHLLQGCLILDYLLV